MSLLPGQRFRMLDSPDVWRVLHVNGSRAHCTSERRETVTMPTVDPKTGEKGTRTFTASSARTIDISPNSVVQLVEDGEAPSAPPPTKVLPTGEAFYLRVQDGQYLRRVQINTAPGFRYDVVGRERATPYKTEKGAQRSLTEYVAHGGTCELVKEGGDA